MGGLLQVEDVSRELSDVSSEYRVLRHQSANEVAAMKDLLIDSEAKLAAASIVAASMKDETEAANNTKIRLAELESQLSKMDALRETAVEHYKREVDLQVQ